MVPVSLDESRLIVSPVQEVLGDPCEPLMQDDVTFHVPTRLPPQPATFPQLPPPPPLELLQPTPAISSAAHPDPRDVSMTKGLHPIPPSADGALHFRDCRNATSIST